MVALGVGALGVVALGVVALGVPGLEAAAFGGSPVAGEATPLEETRAGVVVDWQAGTLRASGGAAADLRMPSVDLARPGAVRRATATALERLRAALGALPIGAGNKLGPAEVERAAGRARSIDVQYQSNGGAVVRVEARFGDWLEPAAPPSPGMTLAVAAMHLSAAPVARIGGRDLRLGAAVYRIGPPPPGTGAIPTRVDQTGRLVITAGSAGNDKLARGLTAIYVQRVLR